MEPDLKRPTVAVVIAGVSIIALIVALIWGVSQARTTASQARTAAHQARVAAHQGAVAHKALCIQYQAYVAQRAQGERLLAAQSGPTIRWAGLTLTRSAVERSVRLETAQINALSILRCKE